MEDIKMQLVKIHGSEKTANSKTVPHVMLDDSKQTFQEFTNDIVDSGALDNSSDSDYEPPGGDNTDVLLQAAATAEKNLGMCYELTVFANVSLWFWYYLLQKTKLTSRLNWMRKV